MVVCVACAFCSLCMHFLTLALPTHPHSSLHYPPLLYTHPHTPTPTYNPLPLPQVDPEAWYQPLLKVGIDQTIWSLFWNSLYYVLLGMMKFESPHVIVTTVTSSWWDLLKAGWRLWPFAHGVCVCGDVCM